jgi:uncharacterized protein (TIGR02328 family)
MRLWHYQLLPLLDDFHIVAQWRELLAIKGAIDKNGTPNHRLVNKVLDFSILDFKQYTFKVAEEMQRRKIKFVASKLGEVIVWECDHFAKRNTKTLYEGWHNNRYLTQCYYNLQEKADCGIVSKQAWARIDEFYKKEMGNGTLIV